MVDLCEKDKVKIGKLVMQVMEFDKAKQRSAAELAAQRQDFEAQIERYKAQNQEIIQHTVGIKTRFSHSLTLLRAYQLRIKGLQSSQRHEVPEASEDEETDQPSEDQDRGAQQGDLDLDLDHRQGAVDEEMDTAELSDEGDASTATATALLSDEQEREHDLSAFIAEPDRRQEEQEEPATQGDLDEADEVHNRYSLTS